MNIERAKAKLSALIMGIEDGWRHKPTELEKEIYKYFSDYNKALTEDK